MNQFNNGWLTLYVTGAMFWKYARYSDHTPVSNEDAAELTDAVITVLRGVDVPATHRTPDVKTFKRLSTLARRAYSDAGLYAPKTEQGEIPRGVE